MVLGQESQGIRSDSDEGQADDSGHDQKQGDSDNRSRPVGSQVKPPSVEIFVSRSRHRRDSHETDEERSDRQIDDQGQQNSDGRKETQLPYRRHAGRHQRKEARCGCDRGQHYWARRVRQGVAERPIHVVVRKVMADSSHEMNNARKGKHPQETGKYRVDHVEAVSGDNDECHCQDNRNPSADTADRHYTY